MKVTVCFDNVRVVVPCGDGSLLVKDLMHEAVLRYRKATGKTDGVGPIISSLSSLTGGGLLDPDDRLCDVADDREQIVAHFSTTNSNSNNSNNNNHHHLHHHHHDALSHVGGDGASSVGTNSPDFFHLDDKDNRYGIDVHTRRSNIKRESIKRLSMHALSTRDPCLTTYSALSLPRESRRREPLGQDAAKIAFDNLTISGNNYNSDDNNLLSLQDGNNIKHIIIKNEAGPLGLHVVPCYDLLGNDQGLRVEGIEPNGCIAKDGQIQIHDKIIQINGQNLLGIPFSQVQDIFRSCMNESCLKISVLKNNKNGEKLNNQIITNNNNIINSSSSSNSNNNNSNKDDKLANNKEIVELDDSFKKIQCSNYNLLQSANTRKIGRMIEIELIKGNNGLGFSVTTRDNPAGGHCPIYIKNILSKGAAVEDGRLKPGDRLLEVNKIQMTGKSQSEVVSLLRSISPGGKVRILVSRQEDIPTTSSSSSSSMTQAATVTPSSNVINNNNNETNINVNCQRSGGGGGGGGGDDNNDNKKTWNSHNSTPVKKQIAEIGLDKVENNNGNNIVSSTSSNSNITSSRHYKTSGSSSIPYKIIGTSEELVLSPRKNRMILTLEIPVHDSEKAGLGVSVKGKTSNADDNPNMDLGIFIKSVIHGGAASRDGRLRTNDQLLNINGISLLGLSNSDAMETLRRAMFNKNSGINGVITLTIARRISSFDNDNYKLETCNNIYTSSPTSSSNNNNNNNNNNSGDNNKSIDNKNYTNYQQELIDSTNLATGTSWNPVIDRLTEQYNKNSLRNESYCLATNKTWIESAVNTKKLLLPSRDDPDMIMIEEISLQENNVKKNIDDKDSQYSGDPTYDSQLSLEEVNNGNKFSRDALGRQSMSEKRHAALDAKSTDTYKRNKKLRQDRESKSNNQDDDNKQQEISNVSSNNTDNNNKKDLSSNNSNNLINDDKNSGESSFEAIRRRFEKKCDQNELPYNSNTNTTTTTTSSSSYNKYTHQPKKHWLVDDTPGIALNDFKTDQGFSNTRGDVKQSSLNSALDKRSRKKGFKSMLRLGKNRKSLNFGDNIEVRHDNSTYCSGTINYIA